MSDVDLNLNQVKEKPACRCYFLKKQKYMNR